MAQIAKKDFNNLKKKPVKEFEPISIVKGDKKKSQVNELYELERKIIEILILYGNDLIDFEEEVFLQSKDGGSTRKNSKRSLKVLKKSIWTYILTKWSFQMTILKIFILG